MILSMVPFKPRFNYPPDGIGKYVSEQFGIPVYDAPTADRAETVFCISGHFGYCAWRKEYIDIVREAKRVVYLCNDYSPGVPSQLKPFKPEIWSHIQGFATHFVPWTVLSLGDLVTREPSKSGLMYYGALRPRRIPLFDRYLRTGDWISTSKRGIAKWEEYGNFKYADLFKSSEDLAQFEWTVYMEDPDSGQAILNRFFECLTAGVPMIFAEGTTLHHFGVNPFPVVRDRGELDRIMQGDRATLVAAQRDEFLSRPWHQELKDSLFRALCK